MKISLIISFYKNTTALELIIKALEFQTFKDFEVIIAEDDNNLKTREFISQVQENSKLIIKHICQDKDDGFRKNKILNQAILASESDFIVFLDGDCIPHKGFLQAYSKCNDSNTAFFGRRVMVGPKHTQKMYINKNLNDLRFWKLVFSDTTRLKYALYIPFLNNYRETGIWGCNWGIAKNLLIAVNGFDEDYITAGVGEDIDIEFRLKVLGVKLKSTRFSALQFHLHHPPNYSNPDVQIGYAQLEEKKTANLSFCKNGIVKSKT